MPKKPQLTKQQYAKRARELRSYGFNLSLKGNTKQTPQQKAAVSRAWYRARFYTKNADSEDKRIEFKRFRTASDRRKWAAYVSPEQISPGGVWLQRPKGVSKGSVKWTLRKDGTLAISASGKTRIRDIVIRLDMQAVADDTKAALEKTLSGFKRPRQLLLTVNGLDAGQSFDDLEAFNRYLEEELIPRLDAAEFDYDKWGDQVFGLKLVYTPKGGKKVKSEGKVFDFEKGGIFDESSKRVYGLKKFKDRKQWVVKKGKRKGT